MYTDKKVVPEEVVNKVHEPDWVGKTRLAPHIPSSSRAGKRYNYCYYKPEHDRMQRVDSSEVQGQNGEGHHGCICPQGSEEGHCPPKHSKLAC